MHDVPWPADFGGVVDLYSKLVTLSRLGIKIHLHCFLHKRPAASELEQYCETVTYYKRNTGLPALSFKLPYIVSSRISAELEKNLLKDDHPILMEGIHSTYLLNKGVFNGRKILVRLHNVEFRYYKQLAKNESNFFKAIYYKIESRLLYQYEKGLSSKAKLLTVSNDDAVEYHNIFKADAEFLPVFLPWDAVRGKEGRGNYCLYQGNLEVNENQRAAEWLIEKIFSKLQIPLVIAGKNPPSSLIELEKKYKHVCIISNPAEHEMQDMISKAHINILPSFNNTGVKLKLLNAMYNGRFCLVNSAGVSGSGLEDLCLVADTDEDMISLISQTYTHEFTNDEIVKRSSVLSMLYDNNKNAERLIALLY